MSPNFNLAIARDHVHAIACQMHKIEVAVNKRRDQEDLDLAEHRRLQKQLEDAEHELWLEKIVLLCNTQCRLYRVK